MSAQSPTPLAIATDFMGSAGDPERPLRLIAEAGFTHLHWCHQWNTDHLYTDYEIARYAGLLRRFGLRLLDIHGSDGGSGLCCWYSPDENYRHGGVELVLNRLRMMAALHATGALMMHPPGNGYDATPEQRAATARKTDALRRSLDEILPVAEGFGIPIAIENLPGYPWDVLDQIFSEYPKELVGLCYDSGHGNIRVRGTEPPVGLDHLEQWLDRLHALHLHDNDGSGDQHQPPFYGNVDWARLAADIRRSAYPRVLSFELAMHNVPETLKNDPAAFLADAHERCLRVQALHDSAQP